MFSGGKNKTKIINFRARNKFGFDTQLKPYPASQNIPQWWKDGNPYLMGQKKLLVDFGGSNASWKKCTPMLDSLLTGYIIPLWTDVQIRNNEEEGLRLGWRQEVQVFQHHSFEADQVNRPTGYLKEVFKYACTWIPQTPPGYSILITTPFGWKDNPIVPIPAVLDSDKSILDFSPPMWIKDGFEGIVEKGTPLIQLIPFKRDDWESTFDYYEDGEFEKNMARTFNGTIVNHYIKNIWSKKSFK